MDHPLNYADIIKQALHEATSQQPRLQAIKLYPICDAESGHFLVVATGWQKDKWMDSILFHARLVGNQVIVEEDNFEEGLSTTLIQAGINAEHITSSQEYQPVAS